MDKKLLFLIKVLSIFIKKDKNLITILFKGYSGSNATPIIEKLTSEKSMIKSRLVCKFLSYQ